MSRGQTLGMGIMVGIFVLIIGLMSINLFMPEVVRARTNLNCASPSDISDGTKLLCLVIDTTVPYWVVIIFSILMTAIVSRLNI